VNGRVVGNKVAYAIHCKRIGIGPSCSPLAKLHLRADYNVPIVPEKKCFALALSPAVAEADLLPWTVSAKKEPDAIRLKINWHLRFLLLRLEHLVSILQNA
jgi:hypothetical protein